MLWPVSWRNWNWMVLWRHTRPSRTRTQKTWDWNAKGGSQEISRVTGKFGLGVQNEAGQRLTEFCKEKHTGHSKHPLPTIQEKTLHMDISPDGQYQNKLIIYFAAKGGEALYSHQKRNALVIANTLFQQYTRRLHTHGHHHMVNTKIRWLYTLQPKVEKLYKVIKSKMGSSLWLKSWIPYCQIQT